MTLSAPSVAPDFDRAVLGIPDGYLFLFCFDLLSIFERKNPLAPIASFKGRHPSGGLGGFGMLLQYQLKVGSFSISVRPSGLNAR